MQGRNYRRNQAYNSSTRQQQVRIQEIKAQEIKAQEIKAQEIKEQETQEIKAQEINVQQERASTTVPSEQMAQVRFFNAAAGFPPMRVVLGDTVINESLEYIEVTPYQPTNTGFQTITITLSGIPNQNLLSKSIPFQRGDKVTLAIINSASGIDIKQMNDKGCENAPDMSCFRMANFSYTSGPVDILLEDGDVVFSDVRFKEVTDFKQAVPGEYNFTVVLTREQESPISNEINIIEEPAPTVEGGYLPENQEEKPVMYFYEDLEAGELYTAVLIGNVNMEPPLQVVTI